MHGLRRKPLDPSALAARKEKERREINEYHRLDHDISTLRSMRDHSIAAFDKSTEMLKLNPEYYTIWNYRREIILASKWTTSFLGGDLEVLKSEMHFTMSLLRLQPKVYWIWNHRRWCLEQILPNDPDGKFTARIAIWDQEVMMIETMLERDPRNFHAWNYRRYVLADHPNPHSSEEELDFTKHKIQNNFSNFSAWHQRSKVIGSVQAIGPSELHREFELVKSALWTDPGDQSAWIYHRWLIGDVPNLSTIIREIGVLRELLLEEPNAKWCIEMLSHYLLLWSRQPEFRGDLTAIQQERRSLLLKMESLDPLRRQRYRELAI